MLRDAIPIMELLKEMKRKGYPIRTAEAKVHCRVFEDNSGALEMAKIHKYRPRTKHLNVKLHHFRDYVERGEISIHDIATQDQPADFLTKALNEDTQTKHRRKLLGWKSQHSIALDARGSVMITCYSRIGMPMQVFVLYGIMKKT